MNPVLLKDQEFFMKKASSTPAIKKKKKHFESYLNPKEQTPRNEAVSTSNYRPGNVGSQYKFGVLAKIVRHLKRRHQEGDDKPLTLDEILDETEQLDVGPRVKLWLLTEALLNNPKITVTQERQFLFKPPYKIRDKKGLLRLLKQHDLRGIGGILLEDIQESLPYCNQVIKSLQNEIIYITRPKDKKKIIFYNDRTANIQVDDEFRKLWRAIAVESVDDEKIEEYLKKQGIRSMQDHGLRKTPLPLKRKKPNYKKKHLKKPKDNVHLRNILEDYGGIE